MWDFCASMREISLFSYDFINWQENNICWGIKYKEVYIMVISTFQLNRKEKNVSYRCGNLFVQ
jgi:hypothetical protein